MTVFDKAFDYTMGWEGGSKYTNDPDDPGGETKYGISKRSHPNVDIKNLDETAAKIIYAMEYWGGINGNEVAKKSERVAIKLFDMAVNLGQYRASRMFQQALNQSSRVEPKLEEDGRIGNGTLRAIDLVPEAFLLEFMTILLEQYYERIGNEKFLKGWLRRARALP